MFPLSTAALLQLAAVQAAVLHVSPLLPGSAALHRTAAAAASWEHPEAPQKSNELYSSRASAAAVTNIKTFHVFTFQQLSPRAVLFKMALQ